MDKIPQESPHKETVISDAKELLIANGSAMNLKALIKQLAERTKHVPQADIEKILTSLPVGGDLMYRKDRDTIVLSNG